MSGFLLDTNCVSEAVRIRPDARVAQWLDSTDEQLLYLSALTLGEIRKGIAVLSHGKRRAALEAWLEGNLKPRFAGRILPVDEAVAERWGWLDASLQQKGTPLPIVDGLLAATALHYNLTTVTRNVSHFADAGVAVLNPWLA